MSRVQSARKNLSIEVQLLFAQFLETANIRSHYSLTIFHNLTQFQTTLYPTTDSRIDFSTLQPFVLQNQLQHVSSKHSTALLKIAFTPSGSECKLQTIVDERSIVPFCQQMSHNQKKGKRSNSFVLAFPILLKGRVIVGQINIKFTFCEIKQLGQASSSRVFSSKISKNSVLKQPKKVFSSSNATYFNPCVSRGISVVASEEADVQQDQQKREYFIHKSTLHHNLQFQVQKTKQCRFGQQNTRNQQNQLEICEQKPQSIQDRNNRTSQKDRSYEVQVPLSNHIATAQPAEIPQTSRFQQIPQDYRYLFQKICEINKKYAPLQRIASQQQLSEEVRSETESFYSLGSQFGQTGSNALSVAQQLLKQLNLYKFGQSLLQSQASPEHH